MLESSSVKPRYSLKVGVTTLLVSLAFVFRVSSSFSADLSYVLLALVALLGRRQAIIALALAWFFTVINTGLVPEASFFKLGRYLVILAAATSVFLRSQTKPEVAPRGLIWVTWLFAMFIFMHSLLISPFVDVSLLKLTSWMMVFMTLLSAWGGLIPDARAKLANQFFWAFAVLALLSLPLFFLPEGFLRNGNGFQGLLNHPQAFGVAMACLGAWAFARVLSARQGMYAELLVFVLAFLLIIASETRTAGAALLFSIVAMLVLLRLTSRKKLRLLLPALQAKNFRLLGLFFALLFFMLTPQIAQLANDYLTKSGRADVGDLISAYEKSRGKLYLPMLENIAADPLKGIGYGVASDPHSLVISRESLFGLPTGAPVEKGIMPLAILEELGVLGFGIFILWLLIAFRYAMKSGAIGLALSFVVFFLNLGEAIFFSPGGMGLLTLLLFTYAVTPSTTERHKSGYF